LLGLAPQARGGVYRGEAARAPLELLSIGLALAAVFVVDGLLCGAHNLQFVRKVTVERDLELEHSN